MVFIFKCLYLCLYSHDMNSKRYLYNFKLLEQLLAKFDMRIVDTNTIAPEESCDIAFFHNPTDKISYTCKYEDILDLPKLIIDIKALYLQMEMGYTHMLNPPEPVPAYFKVLETLVTNIPSEIRKFKISNIYEHI